MNSNRVLFNIIYEAVIKSGMPENCMLQLEARSEITDLLTCNESVDLLIPRGSNAFVQYIMNNTKIPVMGHADGICHIYVDKEADFKKAIPIIIDAKTQYVSACNSVETLLIHKDIVDEFVPKLYEALKENNVELRGTEEIVKLTGCNQGTEEDNRKEYLDYIVSAKVINSLDEAIEHINYFGSHHTDCIITENSETANEFMRYVDSAGVYQNCSTRFADGYRYGFGAEGDWKSAALYRTVWVMNQGLPKGCSFLEDYTLNFDGANSSILQSHMLEICPLIAANKPRLEVHFLGIGIRKSQTARLVFTSKTGTGCTATVVDMGNRFRLIVNDVECIEPKPLPKLPVASALWIPMPNLEVGAGAWILAGGTHHSCFSYDLTAEYWEDYAEIAGIEMVHINKDTTISCFKKELRMNEVYYMLNKALC